MSNYSCVETTRKATKTGTEQDRNIVQLLFGIVGSNNGLRSIKIRTFTCGRSKTQTVFSVTTELATANYWKTCPSDSLRKLCSTLLWFFYRKKNAQKYKDFVLFAHLSNSTSTAYRASSKVGNRLLSVRNYAVHNLKRQTNNNNQEQRDKLHKLRPGV